MQQLTKDFIDIEKQFLISASLLLSNELNCAIAVGMISRNMFECVFDLGKGLTKFRISCSHPDYPEFVLGNIDYDYTTECQDSDKPFQITKKHFLSYFPDKWSVEQSFEFLDKLVRDNAVLEKCYEYTRKNYDIHTLKDVYGKYKSIIMNKLS